MEQRQKQLELRNKHREMQHMQLEQCKQLNMQLEPRQEQPREEQQRFHYNFVRQIGNYVQSQPLVQRQQQVVHYMQLERQRVVLVWQ